MITHNLVQGTPAWAAVRASHFTASEAPAMMGCSPYTTRSALLEQKATGLAPEVDIGTQMRFDNGHAVEAAFRPIAEGMVGNELYPVTGSLDVDGLPLLASFDGLTMDGSTIFEHKAYNRDTAHHIEVTGEPPIHHVWQLEQQLLVAGANRALFVSSDGTMQGATFCTYTSQPERRAALIAGWKQFAADLASYTPAPATTPAPTGRTPETLPALHIEVTGMVTASNLADFKAHALAVFGGINRELVTDHHFADAEKTIKWCGEIESRLAAAKQHALSQTASIDELFRTIDDISAEARATRLELDRLVKARKDTLRAEIVADGRNAMSDHITALDFRIGAALMPPIAVDFAGAIKGKRSLDSMRDAVATELARAKIEANAVADKIALNLKAINAQVDFQFLFPDLATLARKEPEFVEMAIKNRVAEHQAKEAARIEAERARIAAEERAKAEATERARADAEIAAATAKARAEAHAQASADAAAKRASDEAIAKAKSEAILPAAPAAIAQAAIEMQDTQADSNSDTSPPTLKLGQIAERLGFQLTANFLNSLGFKPAATDGRALLFHENDFPRMCAALVRHIQQVAQEVAA